MANKSTMTVDKFKGSILPNLSIGCKDQAELQQKAVEFLSDIDLTDSEGNIVEVSDLDLPAVETKSVDLTEEISKAVKSEIEPLKKVLQSLNGNKPIISTKGVSVTAPSRKRWGSLTAFKNDEKGEEAAYRMGCWAQAALFKDPIAKRWCAENGVDIKTIDRFGMEVKVLNEGTNTAGGYLVPDEFSANLVRLVLDYGAFRRNARVVPMSRETLTFPRRTAGNTAVFLGENAAGTESDLTFDDITLVAKKAGFISRWSNEVNSDSAIALGDLIAQEAALAFAYLEDNCGFNGTGAGGATYGGITGVRPALTNLNGTDDGGGIALLTGNIYSEHVLADFTVGMGRLPTYARANAKWYCAPIFADAVLHRLQTAAGGNTVVEIADGGNKMMFLGYPVELVEAMPSAVQDSTIHCLFGDLSKAATFGDRMQTTVAFSDTATVGGQSMFERDQMGVRYLERFDINVHDIGTASAAGPIIGFQSQT